MEHSYLVQKALAYLVEEMKLRPETDLYNLCDEAGARFNLSPIEVDSLARVFREENNN